jgi:hypothetical protein
MAQPARRAEPRDEPPVDPEAVSRAYRYHRARRNARARHKREKARARLRFFIVLMLLIALSVFLIVAVWQRVEAVFGL